nr:PAS domain S-box protein [Haloprofundus salinisoli]
MLDSDGEIASWNEGAERIKGYTEDEIIGEHISNFYTDADIDDGVPHTNLETAATEGPVEDEGWRVRKDGSRFWANVVITAIRDEDGTLQGFTKVTRDMTERREYEQQLRQERDFTQQILETVPVSICTVTPDGEFARANRQALEHIDGEESDLTEYTVDSWELYDGEGNPIPTDEWPWTQVTDTGDPVYDYQCQVDLPDIGRRWLSINAAPIEGDQSEDDRVVFTADDITEQKERERQLRRESKQTEKLLRTAPIAIAVQNAEGEMVLANQRAQEALGLSEQEIIEEPDDVDDWEVYDAFGDQTAPHETPSSRVLTTGEAVLDEELVIDPPSGEQMQFRINAAPLFGPDGTVERVITAGEDITELKRRERQLEQRKSELETELSGILGRISDAFYALDEEWQFTHINDRAVEIFQQPEDELLGRSIWEVFPEETEGTIWENFHTAMDTQETVSFELYVEEIDSWLEFNVYPSETGLSIYFRDITDRKANEQELAMYETIIETIHEAIYVLDDDLQFTMVNEAFTELTGYARDELLGEHASLVVDEETIERGTGLRGELADGKEVSPTLEIAIETVNDNRIPVEGSFTPLLYSDGEHKRIGVLRDITERKESRRKLEESERRYRTLVEHFPNGAVALFDEDLCYTTAGGELMNVMGTALEDRIGTSIHDLYPDELLEEIEPYFHAALEGDEHSFEAEYLGRHLLAYTLPIQNADDEVYAGMLVVQDITEFKETQRRLEASNERLEQFAYAASHDLQEPLRMISSYLQLVEQRYADVLDEDGEEFLEFAVDGAKRMRDMIDALLTYSRIETQGDPFEPVDLDTVLEDVRENLQMRIGETETTIRTEPLPNVQGDATQLRQVFQNLISNAIEYAGDEPPQVHISAERTGHGWVVSVRDEGIGIDPDDAHRIFEVFQSLHGRADHSGTGIGLALCKRIVERHGGEIWVESEPEEGATFSFTLPVGGECNE